MLGVRVLADFLQFLDDVGVALNYTVQKLQAEDWDWVLGISKDQEDLGQDLVFDDSIDHLGRLAAYELTLAGLRREWHDVNALISDVLSHDICENLKR